MYYIYSELQSIYMTNILSAVIYFPISRNFAIGFFTIFSNIIANYYVDKFIIRKHDKWFRPSIFSVKKQRLMMIYK